MGKGMSGFRIEPRGGGGNGEGDDGGGGGGTKCGRWNPTTEQVKVLTDLFRSGLRTPSTDQIQKISSQLSFYGKIESKNVFYWFQNHKARERQKRRRVSVPEQNGIHRQDPISSTKNLIETNEVPEAGIVIETLQLFPLNSFHESESEKISLFTNEGKTITSYPYTFVTNQVDHPPLDLRLSFM